MSNAACQIAAVLAAFEAMFVQIIGGRERFRKPSSPVNSEVSLNKG
jgi:hypothetical protein